MRKWITLVESALNAPSAASIIDDKMIADMIEEGGWSKHGSDFYRFIEEELEPEWMEDEGLDCEDVIRDPRFAVLLRNWMITARSAFVDDAIRNDLAEYDVLSREMRVDHGWWDSVKDKPVIDLGVFWSAGTAFAHNGQGSRPLEVFMEAPMRGLTVDWRETMISRFDWENGDEENEFQLVRGSRIPEVRISIGGVAVDTRGKSFRA